MGDVTVPFWIMVLAVAAVAIVAMNVGVWLMGLMNAASGGHEDRDE